MRTIADNVAKVAADKARYGLLMQPGATPGEIEALVAKVKARFSFEPPSDYLEFLRLTNGLDWDGIEIFGTETRSIAGRPELSIEGFVSANTRWVESLAEAEGHFFIGTDNDDMLVCDIRDGLFHVVDEVSFDHFGDYPSFGALLAALVDRRLME